MDDLPPAAAWRHRGARTGFEVLFSSAEPEGRRLEGHVAALEEGRAWSVSYEIRLDERGLTRSAEVTSRSVDGSRTVRLDADGAAEWRVNGAAAPHLSGCLDVDLEASAATNALPVRRLALGPGASAEAPAAYVRAVDLRVGRLEQTYTRLAGQDGRYDYAAPAFDFRADLLYDTAGLIVDYPGIGVRAG